MCFIGPRASPEIQTSETVLKQQCLHASDTYVSTIPFTATSLISATSPCPLRTDTYYNYSSIQRITASFNPPLTHSLFFIHRPCPLRTSQVPSDGYFSFVATLLGLILLYNPPSLMLCCIYPILPFYLPILILLYPPSHGSRLPPHFPRLHILSVTSVPVSRAVLNHRLRISSCFPISFPFFHDLT